MSYSLDVLGKTLQNKVIGEKHTLTPKTNPDDTLWIILENSPFHEWEFSMKYTPKTGPSRILQYGLDFDFCFQFLKASQSCNLPIYAGVKFVDVTLDGEVLVNYQAFGSDYSLTSAQRTQAYSTIKTDPSYMTWESAVKALGLTMEWSLVVDHPWSSVNVDVVRRAKEELEKAGLVVHLRPEFLPTPEQAKFIPSADELGLGLVENYPMATVAESVLGNSEKLYLNPKGANALVVDRVRTTLAEMGYQLPVKFAAGITFNDTKKTVVYDDVVYAARQSQVPFVTNGLFDAKKFVAINSNSPAHWINFPTFKIGESPARNVLNQVVLDIPQDFTHRVRARAILNDTEELVYGIDFFIDNRKLSVEYPLRSGDRIRLSVKSTASKTADDRNYYKVFKVASGVKDFQLSDFYYLTVDDLRVTVNDWYVLDPDQDYTINTSGVMSIVYPLELGDIIEVESLDNIPEMGKQQMRSILFAVGSTIVA